MLIRRYSSFICKLRMGYPLSVPYHRLSDETGNMDLDYAVKFIRAYILMAQYIANDAVQPRWTPGDSYEAARLTLFHKQPQ